MMLLDYFISPQQGGAILGSKILGYCFLSIAILGGIFFLFEGLVPLLGYIESGAIACTTLSLIGVILLFVGRKKKPVPQETLSHQALAFLKDLEIEKHLKNNSLAFSLLSFGVGIVLSQFNDPKRISELYKMLR